MRKKPNAFALKTRTLQALFLVNTVIWIGLSVYMLYDMAVINHNGLATVIVTLFMLGKAGGLFLGSVMIGKRMRWASFFSIILLALNILLTFTDQFGIFDLLTLLIALSILWRLISLRQEYLPRS